MSFKAMAWATGCKTGSSTKKLILLLLADRSNDDGVCWPSLDTIAADCELSKECVCRNIGQLSKSGFLHIEKLKNVGKYKNNSYHLRVGQLIESQLTQDQLPIDAGSIDQLTQDQSNLSVVNLSEEPINNNAGADEKGKAAEKEKAATPLPPSTKSFDILIDSFNLSAERRVALDDWLQHKKEKKQAYKPTGLKSLLGQWEGKSDAEFIGAVEFSTAANYAGLFAPKSGKQGGGNIKCRL